MVTRQSLRFKCSVSDCPWQDDEEIHVPWCLGIPDVPHSPEKGHQHHPKKGMGGKNPESKIVAILCNYCHDRIDNGTDWGNAVVPKEDGTLAYWAFDLHGKTLIERPLKEESDGRQAGGDSGAGVPNLDSTPSIRAAAVDNSGVAEGAVGGSGSLTHEQRVAIAQEPEWAELDAVAQEEWFQKLVTDCCEIGRAEHGGVINSKWYMGARICQEERLWDEERNRIRAEYGKGLVGRLTEELVKEFGEGHGYGRSELFQSIQFANKAPEKELSALRGQFRTWNRIKREYLPNQQRDPESKWPKWLRPFDVWNFQIDENYGQLHPGRIPAGIVQNAVHYFSSEGDLVVDPMAGGGVVLDVCEEMGRECVVLDVSPARADIRQWDIAQGYPDEAKDAALVFCDPPYFSEMKTAYGSASISALPRTDYLAFFDKFAHSTAAVLAPGGYLAFLMSDYVEIGDGTCDEAIFTWDYATRFEAAGLSVIRRIYCPLSTQQIGGDTMNKLREAGRMSKLVRELLICRKT